MLNAGPLEKAFLRLPWRRRRERYGEPFWKRGGRKPTRAKEESAPDFGEDALRRRQKVAGLKKSRGKRKTGLPNLSTDSSFTTPKQRYLKTSGEDKTRQKRGRIRENSSPRAILFFSY